MMIELPVGLVVLTVLLAFIMNLIWVIAYANK